MHIAKNNFEFKREKRLNLRHNLRDLLIIVLNS